MKIGINRRGYGGYRGLEKITEKRREETLLIGYSNLITGIQSLYRLPFASMNSVHVIFTKKVNFSPITNLLM